MIGNANLVLYTTETANLLSKLNFGNLNASAEIPTDVKLEMLTGKTTLEHNYFEALTCPCFHACRRQDYRGYGCNPRRCRK